METNTLIATSAGNLAHNVEPLKQWLLKSGVGEMQLILLPSFRRVLVVTESRKAAQTLVHNKSGLNGVNLRYTLTDTEGSVVNPSEDIGRLKVPPSRRQFLVSPPTSPPPEFDYSKCEEPPSSFSHKLSEQSNHTSSDDLGPRTLLSSSAGTITIDPARTIGGEAQDPMPHTVLPPKSIFDEE